MGEPKRIVIADHSELAANLYRLLLAPFGATLVIRKRFDEARPHFFRRETVSVAIFNSNIFGKKFDEIAKKIAEDIPVARVPKIFVCRDSEAEEGWRRHLEKLPNSTVVLRPFHPDELAGLVSKFMGRERGAE